MIVSDLIDYEQGNMRPAAMLALFGHLIETGLAWQLQGHYGRTAAGLIEAGLLSDEAEEWLNAHAPEHCLWDWIDGDFGLWVAGTWSGYASQEYWDALDEDGKRSYMETLASEGIDVDDVGIDLTK